MTVGVNNLVLEQICLVEKQDLQVRKGEGGREGEKEGGRGRREREMEGERGRGREREKGRRRERGFISPATAVCIHMEGGKQCQAHIDTQ